ncbi:sulfatase-like hydrolase/transferase [Budviciaceae bacterium CWB-B4]|uniref:Sulfatase-like hydrolase/transferase n=1 Tax=Limnobaculum xujianqingii TaxID=2738837 RepID=A0A9D7AKC9_9GAMM|nr:sulfatase-like hydrolase/transferase [Limnobaculum xujianqingii]MBK5074591.1 sulfatase-like hydrolase/transferase [Limnobaculum xujianqingii]MBK5177743.1 sulfatase-like hydrolase/transferase [Limnobaculum xujianqingii]
MFTGRGITDSVYYHLLNTVKGSSVDDIFWKIVVSLFFLIIPIILLIISFILKNKLKKRTKIIELLFSLTFIISMCYSNPTTNLYNSLEKLMYNNGSFASQFYVESSKKIDNSNYNYIFIYAESMERTFRNLDGVNYIPRLSSLADSYFDFTNIKQFDGGGWTMAGLVNTQCGIPLSLPQGNSASNLSSFLEGARCIADNFKELGYETTFIRGSEKEFAGGDKFLYQHGWDNIHDKTYFLNNKITDERNVSGWGIQDDVLLNHSYDEFIRLSKKNKNFILSFLTVNTHSPTGKVLGSCLSHIPGEIRNNMLRAIYCSDFLIGDFVDKVIKSPYFNKTIVVIVSDHLMMPNEADEFLDKIGDDRRNNFIVIKKGDRHQKNNKLGTLMDVWPTVLDISNNKNNNKIGFGTSLLDEKDSALISYYLKNRNIMPFISFSSSLWNGPSLNSPMSSDGNLIKISNKTYKLPFYASIRNNKLKDVYFDSFATDAYELLNSNNEVVFATQCYVVNGSSDGTCLYIISSGKIIKRTIGINGVNSEKTINIISPLYKNSLIGFSSGDFSKNSGTSINDYDRTISRGITFFGYNSKNINNYESINFDTCSKDFIDKDLVTDFLNSHENIIFSSNDSLVCGNANILKQLRDITNSDRIMDVTFRQQIGGMISKDASNNKVLLGYPIRQLDFFVDIKTNKLYELCTVLNDC